MGTTRTIPGVSVAFISHQIGLGPRVYLGSERVRPFLDALFCPTEVHFGGAGSGRVRGGFQTNLGVRTYVGRRFALEVATTYVWSKGWDERVFDAAPLSIDGLNQFFFQANLGLLLWSHTP